MRCDSGLVPSVCGATMELLSEVSSRVLIFILTTVSFELLTILWGDLNSSTCPFPDFSASPFYSWMCGHQNGFFSALILLNWTFLQLWLLVFRCSFPLLLANEHLGGAGVSLQNRSVWEARLTWGSSASSSAVSEDIPQSTCFQTFLAGDPFVDIWLYPPNRYNIKMSCCVTWGLGDSEVTDGSELRLGRGVSEAASDEPSVTQHGNYSSGVRHLWAESSLAGQGSVLGAAHLPHTSDSLCTLDLHFTGGQILLLESQSVLAFPLLRSSLPCYIQDLLLAQTLGTGPSPLASCFSSVTKVCSSTSW